MICSAVLAARFLSLTLCSHVTCTISLDLCAVQSMCSGMPTLTAPLAAKPATMAATKWKRMGGAQQGRRKTATMASCHQVKRRSSEASRRSCYCCYSRCVLGRQQLQHRICCSAQHLSTAFDGAAAASHGLCATKSACRMLLGPCLLAGLGGNHCLNCTA